MGFLFNKCFILGLIIPVCPTNDIYYVGLDINPYSLTDYIGIVYILYSSKIHF